MKALQVRTLPATSTKPMRLKVWTADNKPVVYNLGGNDFDVNSVDSIECQAAKKYLEVLGWKYNIAGGQLPNGDHAFVLISKFEG